MDASDVELGLCQIGRNSCFQRKRLSAHRSSRENGGEDDVPIRMRPAQLKTEMIET